MTEEYWAPVFKLWEFFFSHSPLLSFCSCPISKWLWEHWAGSPGSEEVWGKKKMNTSLLYFVISLQGLKPWERCRILGHWCCWETYGRMSAWTSEGTRVTCEGRLGRPSWGRVGKKMILLKAQSPGCSLSSRQQDRESCPGVLTSAHVTHPYTMISSQTALGFHTSVGSGHLYMFFASSYLRTMKTTGVTHFKKIYYTLFQSYKTEKLKCNHLYYKGTWSLDGKR